ncbi:acetyltransferase (GNAT) family protein [Natranaerovirga pectinivora]|uniref:Acetyltransferase (GNAT) family protein n=1 Tax=Natranaerovirga pectinivora TaxID=682400 RepID=A0A4R3MT32_9FIRM|nr:GNAT family N-acetyltransferase [Natranaerovirga pectinivora]TCT16204.1 acetyltransferase (GNAT) family protein [Natranaerovirga pectinivora]
MNDELKVSNLTDLDILEAEKIWVTQYERYCNHGSFPSYWKEQTELLEKFLMNKIKKKSAVVAKLGDKVIGFLAYDKFPFNGENSVFCPAIGHAATEEYKEKVYHALYKSISQEWVNKSIFNHMWTIFYNDDKLKKILFDLGYGSYLIDAFSDCNILYSENATYDIRKASTKDTDVLYELVKESNHYYSAAPLFLKRDELTLKEIEELILKSNVFIAWDKEIPIGFMNLSITDHNNCIDLSVKDCGLINEIGTYIKVEYRNKKIGSQLLQTVNNYCREVNARYIHVDFETSNLYGNKFWKKYFNPMLLSMRRTINKNIND